MNLGGLHGEDQEAVVGAPWHMGPVLEQRFPPSNIKGTTWTRAEGAIGLVHIKDALGCWRWDAALGKQ